MKFTKFELLWKLPNSNFSTNGQIRLFIRTPLLHLMLHKILGHEHSRNSTQKYVFVYGLISSIVFIFIFTISTLVDNYYFLYSPCRWRKWEIKKVFSFLLLGYLSLTDPKKIVFIGMGLSHYRDNKKLESDSLILKWCANTSQKFKG